MSVALLDKLNQFANQFGDLLGDIADDVRAHVELAAQLLERSDYEAALRELQHALEKRRDHARAHYLLGLCYLRRGEPGDLPLAKQAFADALCAKEGFAEAHMGLGDALRKEGDAAAASEQYRLALPLLDDEWQRAQAEQVLGELYLAQGQLDKAVRELRKSVSEKPEDSKAQGLLGQALLRLAQKKGEAPGGPNWEAARQCLQKAAAADSADPQTLTALGKLLLQLDQVPDAEKALLRAAQAEPENCETLLLLCELRLVQGDLASAYEQALRAYASAKQPGQTTQLAQAHRLLARCHLKNAAPERAVAALCEAETVLPADEVPLRKTILLQALEIALGHELFAQALTLSQRRELGDSPLSLCAQAHDETRPVAEAEALLTKAQTMGEHVELRLAWAALERRKGNRAHAASEYRRAQNLVPADPRPKKALQLLFEQERALFPRDLYGLLLKVHQHFAQTPELSEWLAEAGKLVETLDRPLLVTVMGEFNSGKSTFVNALLGEEVAPMGITPTTATINILRYGRERAGRVLYRDGKSRNVAWEKVPQLLRGLDSAEASRIRLVEVLFPLEVLLRVNVVDTPGLNSILPEHEQVAREFIAQADAVIWLFTVDQAGKHTERDALLSIRNAGKKILGVLNKIDRLGPLSLSEETAVQRSTAADAAPKSAGETESTPATQTVAAASAEAIHDQAQTALAALLDHLHSPETGLADLLEVIVPFSGRDALFGRRNQDAALLQKANLPALEQALEERFFARAQALKGEAVRSRLRQLLDKAQKKAETLLAEHRTEELDQAVRLIHADSLLFLRDFLPGERKRLIADSGQAHKVAAQETLWFVRPKRWPFGEHQAAVADRDFLLNLLDEKLLALCQESRARVVAALGLTDTEADQLELLGEQVYGRYLAFSRGYLRGGKVDDFFVRVLPKLDLNEAAIARALERDSPTAVDILESELFSPLRSFAEYHFRRAEEKIKLSQVQHELRQLDISERLLFPLSTFCAVLEAVG